MTSSPDQPDTAGPDAGGMLHLRLYVANRILILGDLSEHDRVLDALGLRGSG